MTRNDQHGRPHPLSKAQCLPTETTKFSPFLHPEESEPDDTQRPTCSSAPFVERLNVYRPRLLKSPRFFIQRKVSPMTRNDQHGRPHPLSKAQCLSAKTTKVSPFRHLETIVSDDTQRPSWSSAPFGRRLNVFRSRLL